MTSLIALLTAPLIALQVRGRPHARAHGRCLHASAHHGAPPSPHRSVGARAFEPMGAACMQVLTTAPLPLPTGPWAPARSSPWALLRHTLHHVAVRGKGGVAIQDIIVAGALSVDSTAKVSLTSLIAPLIAPLIASLIAP